MIYLPAVPGLRIVSVMDRGVPNTECVALKAEEQLDMGHYGLMLGWLQSPGVALPMNDFLFYFGGGQVQKDDWIFVYTGAGQARKNPTPDGKAAMYSVHWGRATTLFANSNVVPILFQLGNVTVGQAPQDKAQLPSLEDRVRNQLLGK